MVILVVGVEAIVGSGRSRLVVWRWAIRVVMGSGDDFFDWE
jgi:hypothetical protein